MELDKYLGLFIDESQENLQKLNENLLALEQNPGDLDLLNDIFRVAHTLKGMSRTMGFNDMADLTHSMENVLEPLRTGDIKATENVVNTLFKCLDKLESILDNIINNKYEDKANNIEGLIKLVDNLNNKKDDDKSSKINKKIDFNEYESTIIKNSLATGYKCFKIDVKLNEDCILPSVRAFMITNSLEEHGEIVKVIPNVEEIEQGNFGTEITLFILTQVEQAEIENAINSISEVKSVDITIITDISKAVENTQEADEKIQTDQEEENNDEIKTQQVTKIVPQSIRVSADRLDKLMNVVGELVINKTRINQLTNEVNYDPLTKTVDTMGNITNEIQEIVMKLRMVPIEQVFNRFPRLVRDISKELNKEINLKIKGKDTEIDRVVIDEIGDPLIHIIRNSLDHGLETAEERIVAGKNSTGTLELSAFNEGDNIVIKVSDDGKGIDPENISKIAIKKDVITAEKAATLTEKEKIDLIFAPGFSTVEKATDLSGRGVGMDVVKSKVSSLGGSVSIASKVAHGTTIIISLPSTMAIIQALMIKVGNETYAMPLNYISEIIDIDKKEIKKVQHNEVIVLRGNTLPLVRLDKLLDVDLTDYDSTKDIFTVVVVKTQTKVVGVIVSELIGQQEVVIKPINKKLTSLDYFSGATTLGNGEVALILNINSIA